MTSPAQLLTAIYKSDPDVGALFAYNVALDLGEQAMREYKEEIIKFLPQYLATSSMVLKRSIGRDYISKAANGQHPEYDLDLVEAYEGVRKSLEVISKLSVEDIEVRGNRFTIYRASNGQFARKGIDKPAADREERANQLFGEFYHPSARYVTGPGRPTNKWVPEQRQAKGLWDASAVAGGRREDLKNPSYATTPLEPATENRLIYALQAQKEANHLTEMLEHHGVINPNAGQSAKAAQADELQVDVALESSTGKKKTATMVWDTAAETFRLPVESRVGYAITDYTVTAKTAGAGARLRSVEGERGVEYSNREKALSLTNPLSTQNLANLNLRDMESSIGQTRMKTAAKRVGLIGRAMNALGIKGGKQAQAFGEYISNVEGDDELRRSMTQAAWRFRSVEAPSLSPSIQVAVEGKKPATDGFTESRIAFYEKTIPQIEDPTGRIPDEVGEAVELGQVRDYTTSALWSRQKARMSNLGMGTTQPGAGVNYNRLAQDIARGIGRGMPSEGVLINRKGKVVTQSMGIGHDGFLPFNAEALSQLSGGQYVRTRQLGGMTGEDLRASLIGNGRAAQVVSGSGVYELEFNPSLRGTRRYNDTAMQMIDTYDRILDEIDQGGHYAVPLPPEREKAARNLASIQAGAPGSDRYEAALHDARQRQYGELAELSNEDISALRQKRTDSLRGDYAEMYGMRDDRGRPSRAFTGPPTQAEQRYIDRRVGEEVREIVDQRARMLSLNSEGYGLALKTLQQYYPYMIRTARYRPWEQFNEEAGTSMTGPITQTGRDRWYRKPGGNLRPTVPGREGEERNAKVGLPAMGARTGRVAATTGGGGGGAPVLGAPPGRNTPEVPPTERRAGGVSPRFNERVESLQKVQQAEIENFSGLQFEGAEGRAISESDIRLAQGNPLRVRLALQMYAQDPEQLRDVFQTTTGEKLLQAFNDPDTAKALAADTDNPIKYKGEDAKAAQIFAAMQGVQATIAAQDFGQQTQIVDGDIGNVRDVPDGVGPVMINDERMTPGQTSAKIDSNPVLRNARDRYDNIRAASNAPHLDPYEPMHDLTAANDMVKRIRRGEEGDETLRTEWEGLGSDEDRIARLEQERLFTDPKTIQRLNAVREHSGEPRLFSGKDDEAHDRVQRGYRLGHGTWLQDYVMRNQADPNSITGKKARGPMSGLTLEELGKSLSSPKWVEDFLEETLALSLTPSSSGRPSRL